MRINDNVAASCTDFVILNHNRCKNRNQHRVSMDISLCIYHHHEMFNKKHRLIVKTNTLHSILELKQAIVDQYPSKVNYFIAPPQFQEIIFHGKVFNNLEFVNDLLSSAIPIEKLRTKSTNDTFPYHKKQGQIILLQFPRTDTHLRQIHDIITEPSKTLHPALLSRKFKITISRVMKIIHYLEASGFIQIDSSESTLLSSPTSEHGDHSDPTLPFVEQRGQFGNFLTVGSAQSLQRTHSAPNLTHLRRVSSNGSISSNGSFSTILRTVVSELAAQILFSDEDEKVPEEEEEDEQDD